MDSVIAARPPGFYIRSSWRSHLSAWHPHQSHGAMLAPPKRTWMSMVEKQAGNRPLSPSRSRSHMGKAVPADQAERVRGRLGT